MQSGSARLATGWLHSRQAVRHIAANGDVLLGNIAVHEAAVAISHKALVQKRSTEPKIMPPSAASDAKLAGIGINLNLGKLHATDIPAILQAKRF